MPKDYPGEGGATGLVEWPISDPCELSCQESGVAGRPRRLKLSLHFELMADGCPLPLSPKWLKSSITEFSEAPQGKSAARPRLIP